MRKVKGIRALPEQSCTRNIPFCNPVLPSMSKSDLPECFWIGDFSGNPIWTDQNMSNTRIHIYTKNEITDLQGEVGFFAL